MKLPLPSKQNSVVTMREIGQKIGMEHPVTVMDVRTQDELEGWNFCDICEYFEDDDRKYRLTISPTRSRACAQRSYVPRVLNQISLEFSLTDLANHVKSPQFVRDIDWIDHMWPRERRLAGDYPRVQYYCLTSTAGCYTDFHVDFGGTSVWYHILSGKKVFLLIPPTKNNLILYEKWLCSKDQSEIFFPDMTGEVEGENGLIGVENCVKIVLEMGQTFIIPTGWIHAVYTPDDSIVFGGNFLHGFDIKGQLDVHCLETRTRVPSKFRFPSFVQLMFYAAKEYYKRLREPEKYGFVHLDELKGLPFLIDALNSWNVNPGGDADRYGSVSNVESQCLEELSKLYDICSMKSLLQDMEHQLRVSNHSDSVPKQSIGRKLKISIKVRDQSDTRPSEGIKDKDGSEQLKTKLKLKINVSPHKKNIDSVTRKSNGDEDDDEIPSIAFKLIKDEPSSSLGYSQRQSRSIGSDLISSMQHRTDDEEWIPRHMETTAFSQKRSRRSDKDADFGMSKVQDNKKARVKKVPEKTTASLQGKKTLENSRSRLMKKLKF
jgi:F-box/leucine-rich repeat protein 10/11